MNNQIKIGILIGIGIMCVLILGYFAYNYLNNKTYQQGYNQGARDLIIKINQDGKVPIIQFNNQTGNSTINYVSIQNICGGK